MAAGSYKLGEVGDRLIQRSIGWRCVSFLLSRDAVDCVRTGRVVLLEAFGEFSAFGRLLRVSQHWIETRPQRLLQTCDLLASDYNFLEIRCNLLEDAVRRFEA